MTKTMNNVTTIFKRRRQYFIKVFKIFIFTHAYLRWDQRSCL